MRETLYTQFFHFNRIKFIIMITLISQIEHYLNFQKWEVKSKMIV